ncbi:MAG TPA: hypothetical protein DDZ34_07655 [Syntrophaceae bacterium]|jgi:hypothetical protein|nr:hypothetical protein [Syntrophaceae bacterium]
MSVPEVIINLWDYADEEQQIIVSLAGRAYIVQGTDEEKTALLQKLAVTDFVMTALYQDDYGEIHVLGA